LPAVSADGSYAMMNSTFGAHPEYLASPEFQRFIAVARRPGSRVLEIGAAYGLTCLEVLRQQQQVGGPPTGGGGGEYVLNDVDRRHLLVSARELSSKFPAESGSYVRLLEGAFPGQVTDLLEPGSFDAILASHVIGLFPCADIPPAFEAFGRLHRPGGVLCIRGSSPHLGYLGEDVRRDVERRAEEFVDAPSHVQQHLLAEIESGVGDALPGYLVNVKSSFKEGLLSDGEKEEVHLFATYCIVLEKRMVEWLVVNRAGLVPERCEYLPTPSNAHGWLWDVMELDGREILSLVATKQ